MENKGTVFERRYLQFPSRRQQTWKSKRPSSLVPEPQTKSDGKIFERKCSQRQKSFRKEISKSSKLNAPRRSSPSGKRGQRPCINYLKRNCTNPSCDCWHPPVWQNYETESGRRFVVKCVFWHTEVDSQQSKKPKKKWWKRICCFTEAFEAIGLRIPGYRAADIQVDSTEEHTNSWDRSAACMSQKGALHPVQIREGKVSIARSNSEV